jgi:hypothetical protein
MQSHRTIPNINHLSVVSAAIMLAFALTQLVSFPERRLATTIFGIVIEITLDFSSVIILLTVILAAAGIDWLIRFHPEHLQYNNRLAYIRHWIMPVLTTLVIGIALNSASGGAFWWVIFGFGSVLLIAVFIAEYNIVSTDELRHPLAVVGLTALSFALLLLLTIASSSANLRLYVRLPVLTLGLIMVISRALYLRLGEWHTGWALICSLVIAEIAVGLHYLPLSPIQYGALLVGIAYALTSILTAIKESRQNLAFWFEPLAMLMFVLLISLFSG